MEKGIGAGKVLDLVLVLVLVVEKPNQVKVKNGFDRIYMINRILF